MTDFNKARYVQLREQDGHYTLVLLDENRREVAHGYRGPTLKRAQQDLKYWTRDKGLQELPGGSS
ncbi:MAG: hypothetical protein JOZ41_03425 [Chloroflexi bacterium]|jgi:hypothetical protein|nr:hypothetical protein [Chloroflexota bacterium]